MKYVKCDWECKFLLSGIYKGGFIEYFKFKVVPVLSAYFIQSCIWKKCSYGLRVGKGQERLLSTVESIVLFSSI